jgi:hypothetical protein
MASGTEPDTTVPRPGALTTVTVPPSAPTRSRRFCSPEPECGASGSYPSPSSATSKRSASASSRSVIAMRETPRACLAAFWTAFDEQQ